MKYETYLADDGTIKTRPIRKNSRNRQRQTSRMILRDDGTIYNPNHSSCISPPVNQSAVNNASVARQSQVSILSKILTWIMMAVCMVAVPLFLNLNNLFRFYKGFGFGLFLLWVMPFVIGTLCFNLAERDRTKVVNSWFNASMVTLYTTLIIWLGAGSYLCLVPGVIVFLVAGAYFLYEIQEDPYMENYLKMVIILSLVALFVPCVYIAGACCDGHLSRISNIKGVIRFAAVLPAFTNIALATVTTIRVFRDY